ncbi:MAG: acyl-CoA/acyl-ACP dehydrogenase [Acidimicrobiia bacterium]|nr:acyl-CoA/acyl-ACP dehydrogenase [Acidimicrobiia bacterium]
MDFELSADQEALRDGIAELLAGRFGIERVRACENLPGAVDRERWRELGEAGVFALRLPEADGGLDLGLVDAAVVFEELGAALVPGPLVWSEVCAGVVGGAADGSTVVGGVSAQVGDRVVIEHLGGIDALARVGSERVARLEPGDVTAEPLARPLDPLTPVSLVEALPEGDPLALAPARARRDGAVLCAAYLVGMARAMAASGVVYALEREQFDRPIGSFQSIKHLLADAAVRVEMARASVHAAALHVDDPELGDVRRAVAGSKHLAGEAAIANARTALQVHGGMGFTWEVDVHLYLKRAWVLDTVFGSADEHADAVAACLSSFPLA